MAGTDLADRGAALAGMRVLVTRPAHQAPPLCQLIERAGGTAIRFPTIDIAPPANAAAFERIVDRLDDFDVAIFVSPNAVARALTAIRARGRELPARLVVACVGAGSAQALATHGVSGALVPSRSDSEGLLELAPLREAGGKRVVIFRGEGGRELLADTLKRRGAAVEYAECYRRVRPPANTAALVRDFMQGRIDVVTVTSADALHNLYDMLGPLAAPRLSKMPLVVVSTRLRDLAQELGHDAPLVVTAGTSDEAIVAAVVAVSGRREA